MPKGKGEEMFKRFWIRGSDETRKMLQHAAIDLDTSAEKLAGMILADVLSKAKGDVDTLRKFLPRKQ